MANNGRKHHGGGHGNDDPRNDGRPKVPNQGSNSPTTPATPAGPSPEQQNAFDQMLSILEQYGLGSLSDVLRGLILDGVTDQASLTLALQDTQEWRTRFQGNEVLRQRGLPVLSVAEYLSVERSYAQVMKNYGLPAGFFDDPSDFADLIGKSVSVNELQQRTAIWADFSKRLDNDPAVKQQLLSMGMGDGDILAYTMDPDKALPLIQQRHQTALIGAAARRQGLQPDNRYASHLADLGVTEQQATQGYGVIAESLTDARALGDIYKTNFTQQDLEKEVFESDGAATKKRKRLASQERASFGGSSGVGQGSLARPTGGSY